MAITHWLFWEGPKPPYIELCIRSVMQHNSNVVVLNLRSFQRFFIHDRDINPESLGWVHASDFIRAHILKYYGGIYIDADCVMLRPLSLVADLLQNNDFVGFRETFGYMSCSLMGARTDGLVISRFYDQVCSFIRSRQKIDWLEIGALPMEKVVRDNPGAAHLLPTDSVMPLCWDKSEQLSIQRTDEEHERYFKQDALTYMLSNSSIQGRDATKILCQLSEDRLLNGNYFLSFLFRKAFNIKK